MAYVAPPKLKKNSVSTYLTSGVTAAAATIPVNELSVFYDADAVLITKGILLGYDNATETLPEEITITGASGVSGPGNLTGATRGVKADGTIGIGYAWLINTRIAVMFSEGIYELLKDDIIALRAGGIPTIDLTGGQIAFPATQAPSANANTLDDYEEGTWTPELDAGGSSLGTQTVTGIYTKIGNIVTLQGTITLTNKGAAAGDVTISGLPFTMTNVSATTITLQTSTVTFVNVPAGYIAVASPTLISLYESPDGGGAATTLTNVEFANSSILRFQLTGRVA